VLDTFIRKLKSPITEPNSLTYKRCYRTISIPFYSILFFSRHFLRIVIRVIYLHTLYYVNLIRLREIILIISGSLRTFQKRNTILYIKVFLQASFYLKILEITEEWIIKFSMTIIRSGRLLYFSVAVDFFSDLFSLIDYSRRRYFNPYFL
jgi:hypothetical protein